MSYFVIANTAQGERFMLVNIKHKVNIGLNSEQNYSTHGVYIVSVDALI